MQRLSTIFAFFADIVFKFVQFQPAEEGTLYPIDGGMIAGIKSNCAVNDAQFMTFSGMKNLEKIFEDLSQIQLKGPLFLELLACEGGCINGPAMSKKSGTAIKRYEVIDYSTYPEEKIPRRPEIDISVAWQIKSVRNKEYSESQIQEALRCIGKFRREDELNCSACGYDTCREFAKAFIEKRAESSMCVSYMRKLAHKKAETLIKTMPSGVVIVDQNLKILECNRRFAELVGDEIAELYDDIPGLEEAVLPKIVPFADLFEQVLQTGEKVIEKDIRLDKIILHITVFTIERNRIVGGFIQDITAPAVRKQQIINKAKEVIKKNLETVQQIASESEVILNSIVNSFGDRR